MQTAEQFTIDDAPLAFEADKQSAMVGWALVDNKFFIQCAHVIKKEWFSQQPVAKLWGACLDLYEVLRRVPTIDEIDKYRPFSQEEARMQTRIREALKTCLLKTKVFGLDLLRKEMTAWIHAVMFFQATKKAENLYNAKKVDEAWRVMNQAAIAKSTSSFEDGVNIGFEDSRLRIVAERAERLQQAKNRLGFGVSFLDDALGGIIPNDLIVLGARTGAGKTMLATSIALANATAGKQVHYFALEAEENEIERRVKYGILASKFYKSATGESICYSDWRQGKLERELGDYEVSCQDEIVAAVKNMHTLYKTSGNFNLETLERHMLEIVGKTDLVIIDHLHYVDTEENENENVAYKKVIKLIRDFVLRYSIPVIVVAHLRKESISDPPLVPRIDDFMGTSDVPKIATTCIMLAPAYDESSPDKNQLATFINVAKSRMEGNRVRYTGVCFFDITTNKYSESYVIGRMKNRNSDFKKLEGDSVPRWAQNHVVLEDKPED